MSVTDTAGRRLVTRVMRRFIGELRLILKRRSPDFYRKFPNAARPCHTCAFNPATDRWRGATSTANELMKAIRDDRPFYCHENLPWRTPVEQWTKEQIQHLMEHRKLCAGWGICVGDPATKNAFIKAAFAERGGEDLATAAIPGAGETIR